MASRWSPPRRGSSTTSRSRSSRGRSAGCRCAVALAAQSNVEAIVDQISQFNFYQGGGWTWRSCRSPRSTLPGTSTSASSAPPPRVRRVHRHLPERRGSSSAACSGRRGTRAWRTDASTSSATGGSAKFRKQVEHVTFSGARGGRRKPVPRHRAGRLRPRPGVELLELAPGCDLERDVLAEMEFRPIIATDLRPMDPVIFEPRRLGLRASGGMSSCVVPRTPRVRGVTGAPRPFRFGLIGAGVAAEIHIAAMRTVPGVEVFAIADVVPERARALAPGTPSPRCTRAARLWPRARQWMRSRC